MPSVTQGWVMELPLREQGVMLSAIRGCDVTSKPFEPDFGCIERHLSAYLRFLILVPADIREVGIPGAFMRNDPPLDDNWKPSEMGHLPVHFFAHLMHAYQVVGLRHPEYLVRVGALRIYMRMVESLHLHPEPEDIFKKRLSEDRLASGKVVS